MVDVDQGQGVIAAPRPRCLGCGRFVVTAGAVEHIEYGDYGTVHGVEYECQECSEARIHDHACCLPGDCCGGPCAAHPCWELTT